MGIVNSDTPLQSSGGGYSHPIPPCRAKTYGFGVGCRGGIRGNSGATSEGTDSSVEFFCESGCRSFFGYMRALGDCMYDAYFEKRITEITPEDTNGWMVLLLAGKKICSLFLS